MCDVVIVLVFKDLNKSLDTLLSGEIGDKKNSFPGSLRWQAGHTYPDLSDSTIYILPTLSLFSWHLPPLVFNSI